ncbi:Uncharacterised protein [Mycobacteroides abscessus subsp. abscessus]|nr:Uncharacterised protein [Mycobacteroides abscessus subsp. abscessus]
MREDHEVVPASTPLCPSWIGFDELTQCVAAIQRLLDRSDLFRRSAGSRLPPRLAVVPYFATLDFEAGDPGALDGHHEIDLVVFVVVGNALVRDEEVGVEELFIQQPPDRLLGTRREAGRRRDRVRHASTLSVGLVRGATHRECRR